MQFFSTLEISCGENYEANLTVGAVAVNKTKYKLTKDGTRYWLDYCDDLANIKDQDNCNVALDQDYIQK